MNKIHIFTILIFGLVLISSCASPETTTQAVANVQKMQEEAQQESSSIQTSEQEQKAEKPQQQDEKPSQTKVKSVLTGENIQTSLEQIKQQAKNIAYGNLMRNNENYKGDIVYFRGEVVQVQEIEQNIYVLRVAITDREFYWEDVVWLDYAGPRVLEGDIIDLWGKVIGLVAYTAILGNEITIPEIEAYSVEVVKKAGEKTAILDENREVLVKSTREGVTLEINSISFEEKGGWGKIKTLGITVINEMNNDLWPHFQIFVHDKDNPNSDDLSLPKWDQSDGWLENGQFLSKEYPIDVSVSGSERTKIIEVDLVVDTYPRKILNSVEFETNLQELT